MENICAAIVTYGNRFHLLKQVIDSCFYNDVDKIVIVDNGSHEESKNRLIEYANNYIDKINIIRLSENTGSAGGFKRVLEEAYKRNDCEYIIMLDDDNVLKQNCLKNLAYHFEMVLKDNSKDSIAFSSYRLPLGRFRNSNLTWKAFLAFHVKDIPNKVKKFFTIEGKKAKNAVVNRKEFLMEAAPYGGLFFHKSFIEKFGYPNENLFLYFDDTEWTYRITKLGGKIFLTRCCEIEDIDIKMGGEGKKCGLLSYFSADKSKVYYAIRNSSYLEKYCKHNASFITIINRYLYLLILWLLSLIYRKKGVFKMMREAIKDGERGNLGWNPKYPLK